jgi:hypothetical protein
MLDMYPFVFLAGWDVNFSIEARGNLTYIQMHPYQDLRLVVSSHHQNLL